jgi:hypothetical protein
MSWLKGRRVKAGAGDVMLDEDDHDTLAPFLVGFAFPNVIKHLYVTKINIHSVGMYSDNMCGLYRPLKTLTLLITTRCHFTE